MQAESRLSALKEAWIRSYRKAPAANAQETDDPCGCEEAIIREYPTSVSPSDSERRIAPRYDVCVQVTLESDHNFYLGFAENVSEGGLFVATHVLKPVGSQVALTFTLPGCNQAIRVQGQVRWVRDYSPTANASPGMGVQFSQLDASVADWIRNFIRYRTPIFYDE